MLGFYLDFRIISELPTIVIKSYECLKHNLTIMKIENALSLFIILTEYIIRVSDISNYNLKSTNQLKKCAAYGVPFQIKKIDSLHISKSQEMARLDLRASKAIFIIFWYHSEKNENLILVFWKIMWRRFEKLCEKLLIVREMWMILSLQIDGQIQKIVNCHKDRVIKKSKALYY